MTDSPGALSGLRSPGLWGTLAALAVLGFSAAIVLAQRGPLAAATVFVDRGSLGGRCDDSREVEEAGAPTTPWCSLDRAVAQAPSGATVLVRRGSYPRLIVQARRQSSRTTIRPFGNERVTVRGITMHDSTWWRVEGLRVTDISSIEPAPGPPGSSAAVLEHVELVRNDFSPHGLVIGDARHLLFDSNRVRDIGMDVVPNRQGDCHGDPRGSRARAPRCGHGIRLARSRHVTIRRNVFERIPADGLQLANVRDVTIEHNTFRRIEPFIDPHEHNDGIQLLGASSDIAVLANTFFQGHGHHGVIVEPLPAASQFAGHTRRLTLENNVFVGAFGMNLYNVEGLTVLNNTAWNVSKGLALRELPLPGRLRGAVVRNNLLQHFESRPGMTARQDNNLIIRGPRGRYDLTGDPRLVDPAANDLRLGPHSPAVDAGNPAGAPTTDRNGVARTGRPDIGAYEYRAR